MDRHYLNQLQTGQMGKQASNVVWMDKAVFSAHCKGHEHPCTEPLEALCPSRIYPTHMPML